MSWENREEMHFVDKEKFIRGEWDSEPDKVTWIDAETGLHCLIRRNRSFGFLCGYVAIDENHPCYGKFYGDVDFSAHGGLTFSDYCHDNEEGTGICHKTENEGEAYWFGFDCGHTGDLSLHELSWGNGDEEYKNIMYVKNECEKLAKSLKLSS